MALSSFFEIKRFPAFQINHVVAYVGLQNYFANNKQSMVLIALI